MDSYVLPKLTDDEIGADAGATYTELKAEYPDWSNDLHTRGHVMDDRRLGIIFRKGLMLWYIKHHLKQLLYYDARGSNIKLKKKLSELFGEDDALNILVSVLEKTGVPQLGIVFQRWKVVAEFMLYGSQGQTDSYMKNIYAIEQLLDTLQQMVFEHIRHLVEGLKISLDKKNKQIFLDRVDIQPEFYAEQMYMLITIVAMDPNSFLNQPQPKPITFNVIDCIKELTA